MKLGVYIFLRMYMHSTSNTMKDTSHTPLQRLCKKSNEKVAVKPLTYINYH